MSPYAILQDSSIVGFTNISEAVYAHWVATGNPKKDVYRLVVQTEPPEVTDREIAVRSFVVNPTTVDVVWTVRPKTADELRKIFTAYEFLLRFTPQERAAFRAAANTDPLVADFQQLASAAQEVIGDDPMTIAGMNYLVSVGLLSQERSDEILGIPPSK
jgi:hypothetical protein